MLDTLNFYSMLLKCCILYWSKKMENRFFSILYRGGPRSKDPTVLFKFFLLWSIFISTCHLFQSNKFTIVFFMYMHFPLSQLKALRGNRILHMKFTHNFTTPSMSHWIFETNVLIAITLVSVTVNYRWQ